MNHGSMIELSLTYPSHLVRWSREREENVKPIENEGQLIPTLAHKFSPLPKVWNLAENEGQVILIMNFPRYCLSKKPFLAPMGTSNRKWNIGIEWW